MMDTKNRRIRWQEIGKLQHIKVEAILELMPVMHVERVVHVLCVE
jgi:uncharacterized pyridoxal phosphate-containing UPF0001 family protein